MATEDKKERGKRAFHDYVDAKGNAVDIEKAVGFAYQMARPVPGKPGEYERHGERFVYVIPGAVAGSVAAMCAVFGADTLSTNTASAHRQASEKGQDTGYADAIAAIRARFDAMKQGDWGAAERTGGPRYDIPTLAKSLVDFQKSKGKTVKLAEAIKRLTDEPEYRSTVTRHEGVMALYRKARGTAATDDDL